MTTKEFVKGFYKEKENLLKLYFNSDNETQVGKSIDKLNLNKEQIEDLKKLLDEVLVDSFYNILLGLDGCSSIGGKQENYKLFDEKGNELTSGDIESFAYELFHDN